MCFNLGATNQTIASQKSTNIPLTLVDAANNYYLHSANERSTYGDLFQWGRIADGHENRNAIQEGSAGNVVATDNCISWNTTTPPTYEYGNYAYETSLYGYYAPWLQVTRGTSYYGKFIKTIVANEYNWYVGNKNDADLLWRESSFAYNDPCAKVNTATGTVPSGNTPDWYPAAGGTVSNSGWRLPNQLDWSSLYRGGIIAGTPDEAYANNWTWYQLNATATEGAKGYEIKPDGATTTLFLPASGHRQQPTGLLMYEGSVGLYWSGSVRDEYSYLLMFFDNIINPVAANFRGVGYALRCVKN